MLDRACTAYSQPVRISAVAAGSGDSGLSAAVPNSSRNIGASGQTLSLA